MRHTLSQFFATARCSAVHTCFRTLFTNSRNFSVFTIVPSFDEEIIQSKLGFDECANNAGGNQQRKQKAYSAKSPTGKFKCILHEHHSRIVAISFPLCSFNMTHISLTAIPWQMLENQVQFRSIEFQSSISSFATLCGNHRKPIR